ncbi:hypothetical protein AAT19DRAFT_13160 [Rhodotorula toruloides]|uniref:Uncharacterized protein n=1 Tax=Rhodotorula toruloides TaxID=5286 RepID=A0A2T0ADR1_RHOTO|nr:hypothetical protein AAT19DRAFT_13160 [Rhodotorula toruloides]
MTHACQKGCLHGDQFFGDLAALARFVLSSPCDVWDPLWPIRTTSERATSDEEETVSLLRLPDLRLASFRLRSFRNFSLLRFAFHSCTWAARSWRGDQRGWRRRSWEETLALPLQRLPRPSAPPFAGAAFRRRSHLNQSMPSDSMELAWLSARRAARRRRSPPPSPSWSSQSGALSCLLTPA